MNSGDDFIYIKPIFSFRNCQDYSFNSIDCNKNI